jgi:hypothetical protein
MASLTDSPKSKPAACWSFSAKATGPSGHDVLSASERASKVMRSCYMTTDTRGMSREEFDRHVRTYRRFVWGVGLFVTHTLVILLLIYYFFGPA